MKWGKLKIDSWYGVAALISAIIAVVSLYLAIDISKTNVVLGVGILGISYTAIFAGISFLLGEWQSEKFKKLIDDMKNKNLRQRKKRKK